MKQEDLNKDYLLQIINNYLNGSSTFEEEELLINYYESFQGEEEWDTKLGLEEDVKEIIHLRILNKINNVNKKETKVIGINFKNLLKYAAAIMVVVSTGYYLTKDTLFNNVPAIVEVQNNVEIGTDKATLTLDDGSIVVLEKGKNFNKENAKSDGEKIVYASKEDRNITPTKEEIPYNYLTVPTGGQFYVELADGTHVWLNSETKFKYPTKFIKGQPRVVELIYGEAYFDVSHSSNHNGSTFSVHSGIQDIEVLGTEFNVRSYENEDKLYTTLVKGKVAINNKTSNKVLNPGQQSVVSSVNNDIDILDIDVSYEIAWKNGLFMFDKKTLKEMMVVLSRWYDVKVVFENKEKEELIMSGVLKRSDHIEELLQNFEKTGGIKYTIQENTLIIK